MSTPSPVMTIKDSTTFTLNEADLKRKKVGEVLLIPKRDIPGFDGLQWGTHLYPAGYKESVRDHVSLFCFANKALKATFTFAVDGSSINKTTTYEFTDLLKSHGWRQFASHRQLRPLFNHHGKLTITCNVEFDVPAHSFSVPRVFQLFESVPMDVELVIGSEEVPAHKSFLALISPVFRAVFARKTDESKTGKIVISDFDFDTVNTAIDICYGREFEKLSVESAVNILRFCDKYFITAVTSSNTPTIATEKRC